MTECLDCGNPMEDIIWEKFEGKCKDCRTERVFTDEEKMEAVAAYLQAGSVTQEQVCKGIGITVNTFSRWRKQFERSKRVAHDNTKDRKNYTDAEKLNILNGYNSHDYKSVNAYCKSVGIYQSMYRKWKIALANKLPGIQRTPEKPITDNIDEVIATLADIQPGLDREKIDDQISLWRQRIDNLMQGALPAQLAGKILKRCVDEMESFLA